MKRRNIGPVQRDIRRPVKNGVNAQRPAVQQGDAGLSGHLQAGQMRGGQTWAVSCRWAAITQVLNKGARREINTWQPPPELWGVWFSDLLEV